MKRMITLEIFDIADKEYREATAKVLALYDNILASKSEKRKAEKEMNRLGRVMAKMPLRHWIAS